MLEKIVIRSPNWIGDCIMALPAIRAVKSIFPDSELVVLAKEFLCPLYKNIPEISNTIPIPTHTSGKSGASLKEMLAFAKILKKHRFHRGILFTNSFSSAMLFKLAGIKNTIGYARDMRGFLLKTKRPFPTNDRHHIHFYLDLAEHLRANHANDKNKAGAIQNYSSQLVLTGEETLETANVLKSMGADLSRTVIGISPSAAYGSAKEWLPERFGALIRKILAETPPPGATVLLLGSEKEKEKISRIVKDVAGSAVHNLAGVFELRQAIAAISLCNGFVSNDSGLMHVASSLGIPLAAIFGPTESHKTGPLNAHSRIIHYPPACAPCLHRQCPIDHPCMKAITVDEVYDTLASLLKDAAAETTKENLAPTQQPKTHAGGQL